MDKTRFRNRQKAEKGRETRRRDSVQERFAHRNTQLPPVPWFRSVAEVFQHFLKMKFKKNHLKRTALHLRIANWRLDVLHAFRTPGVSPTAETVFGPACHCFSALGSSLVHVGTALRSKKKKEKRGKNREKMGESEGRITLDLPVMTHRSVMGVPSPLGPSSSSAGSCPSPPMHQNCLLKVIPFFTQCLPISPPFFAYF